MSLSLLFCHGWGFDAGFWDPLAALLPEFAQVRDDAGYFGAPAAPRPQVPYCAVTHSLGTMRLLAAPPPGLAALIAIDGFDRFTAADAFPGVPRRLVERMIGAFAQVPDTVLADFRARCGTNAPFPSAAASCLEAGLVALRDEDRRAEAAALGVPILSLQGGRDAILPLALRETVFAGAGVVMRRTHPPAGHLLPISDPQWCAEAIRSFLATCL